MSRNGLKLHLIALSLVGLFFYACLEDDERAISETEVPTVILEAFKEAYPRAIVREYRVELEDGREIHEFSFREDGRKMDIAYAGDGTVLELEQRITEAELPLSVRNELNDDFARYEIEEVEKITQFHTSTVTWKLTIELAHEKKKYELLFSEGGRLIDKEEQNEDKPRDESTH